MMGNRRRRTGTSLVVVAIGVAVSAVIFSALVAALNPADSGELALRVRVDFQLDAVRALRSITEVLERSDRGDPPYIGTDGVSNADARGGFYAPMDAANPGIVPRAASADEGLGPSQEIAFRGSKDIGGAGTLAIVLVPGSDGNELQLRRYDAYGAIVHRRLLGRHVERITFETAATEPKPVLHPMRPLGTDQLRVTAWFRRVVDKKVYAARQAGTVILGRSGK